MALNLIAKNQIYSILSILDLADTVICGPYRIRSPLL
jgi:hypothetical protein